MKLVASGTKRRIPVAVRQHDRGDEQRSTTTMWATTEWTRCYSRTMAASCSMAEQRAMWSEKNGRVCPSRLDNLSWDCIPF
eukprot:607959-Heterocapsa_arctica.AAC.1